MTKTAKKSPREFELLKGCELHFGGAPMPWVLAIPIDQERLVVVKLFKPSGGVTEPAPINWENLLAATGEKAERERECERECGRERERRVVCELESCREELRLAEEVARRLGASPEEAIAFYHQAEENRRAEAQERNDESCQLNREAISQQGGMVFGEIWRR